MRQDQQSWTRGYLDALFGSPFNAKDLDRLSYSAGRVEGEAILELQRKADNASTILAMRNSVRDLEQIAGKDSP